MRILSLKQIMNALNLQALRNAPDGNILTGFQVINGRNVLIGREDGQEIYAIATLEGELKVAVVVVKDGRSPQVYENVTRDIDLDAFD